MLFVAVGVASLLGVSRLARGAELAELVQAHGLSPVDPPRPAADFTLPLLAGGEVSLSDHHGSWVVLTFWASWCAPCQVELPSLEGLHRSRGGQRLAVVGVSLDRDRAAARAEADRLRLTFAQLWDGESRVASLYRAVAIPVSYLVDPAGRIVAVARGARDWMELAPMLDALTVAEPRPLAAAYADRLELPAVLDPPSAELELSDLTPLAGQEFFLDVRLRWAGQTEEYLPQPPRVHLPDGVVQQGVTASTDSRAGARVVRYRISLRADRPGSYALDPVELRYTPRQAASEAARRLAGPTVAVRARDPLGLPQSTWALGAAAVLATGVLGLALVLRRRSRRASATEPSAARWERLDSRLQQARRHRLQGEPARSALLLLELEAELLGASESRADRVVELRESLRYGGRKPSAAELDHLERAVARRLEAIRPDADAAARDALRLREQRSRTDDCNR